MNGRVWASAASLHFKLDLAFILSWTRSLQRYQNLSALHPFSDHLPTCRSWLVGHTAFNHIIIGIKLWLFDDWHLDYLLMRSHVYLPGALNQCLEVTGNTAWGFLLYFFPFFFSFGFFFFFFLLISLERRKNSFLYILIPLITPTSCTPRIRRPVLIHITKRGGCKVYRSAKNQAPSLFQTKRLWVNLTHTSSCALTTPPPQLLEIKGGSQRLQLSFYQEYLPMASFSLSSPPRLFLS
jgi:hypothetical protein